MKKIELKKDEVVNECKFIKNTISTSHGKRGVFECRCGNEFEAYIYQIKNGNTKSCGCHRKRTTIEFNMRTKINNLNNFKHGDSGNNSHIYVAFINMKQRCYNLNHKRYADYGGRGIIVYDKWNAPNGYPLFKDYVSINLGERPNGYSLDRIDNDGNYEPNNLRWADNETQNNNKR